MNTQRIERGWAGHFICAHDCMYRRNTLLENGARRIVVSTVGALRRKGGIETIGASGRYYETMVFEAKLEGEYWEADVSQQIYFESPWSICAESQKLLPEYVDNDADKMHENVIAEIAKMMELPR